MFSSRTAVCRLEEYDPVFKLKALAGRVFTIRSERPPEVFRIKAFFDKIIFQLQPTHELLDVALEQLADAEQS